MKVQIEIAYLEKLIRDSERLQVATDFIQNGEDYVDKKVILNILETKNMEVKDVE